MAKLDAIPEGDGSMLDSTLFLYGTGISDSNTHFHDDLPVALVGGQNAGITMTTLGPNVAGVRAALAAGDYSTTKERAIRSREQLATTITFWRDRDPEDAVRWLRTALSRLDALDTALSAESVDAAAAVAIGDEIAEACNACHAVYRELDGDGGYRVNASALP